MNSIRKVECHLVDVEAPRLLKRYQEVEIEILKQKTSLCQSLIDTFNVLNVLEHFGTVFVYPRRLLA